MSIAIFSPGHPAGPSSVNVVASQSSPSNRPARGVACEAVDRLFTEHYRELVEIARRRRRGWHGGDIPDTTSLLHEAYLRLVAQPGPRTHERARFLAVASIAMRHALIDQARGRVRIKRGGGAPEVSAEALEGVLGAEPPDSSPGELLIALDEALHRLAAEDVRLARIVDCRFFGEMTIEETASALGVSPATVKRGWARARAWLRRDLTGRWNPP